ncbi:hypothetical protein O181_030414 [Austropuccinia psidii MF-1]|uniref:Retrotransposon gag domain-containing protein n=1 Tax=Austropuccinia psidii MF-1 TaxID=1389203 RepID=A0A9Q3CU04_9BASI|nr:hypothetical protein [Austropuccinia psidii MF-1]
MPVQNSPPARLTQSQARAQAFLTQTPRAPLDGTPAEGRGPREWNSFSGVVGSFLGLLRTNFKGPGEEEEENSVEEEDSDDTEGVPAPVGVSQGTEGPTLAHSNQPVSHQYEPLLLATMQQMTQIMANIQAASSPELSTPPAFKTPSMRAPECFDGTQPFKEALYAISFLIGRDAKWIEPYISNLTDQGPTYLPNSWNFFESQLFTLFGDPNEVIKSEAELDSLRMKEGEHVSLYISNFRSLVSRIGDWGERALIHNFRKGLKSRTLDQLASHPSIIDSLQDLMDITLELYTRYHERQKENRHH